MRVVHELQDVATVTVGGETYAKQTGATTSSGFKASVLIHIEERGVVPAEELRIEGNARHVWMALKDAVAQMETMGRKLVADGEIDPNWQGLVAVEIVMEEARKAGKAIDYRTADHILWERTGFPCFWHIPRDGATPEECLRTQVRAALSKER